MTVKQLIEALQQLDPALEVYAAYEDLSAVYVEYVECVESAEARWYLGGASYATEADAAAAAEYMRPRSKDPVDDPKQVAVILVSNYLD